VLLSHRPVPAHGLAASHAATRAPHVHSARTGAAHRGHGENRADVDVASGSRTAKPGTLEGVENCGQSCWLILGFS